MKNVQDIYPTSPMQELMLLHSLGRRHNDTLLTQFVFAMERELDAARFERAWAAVIERHAMLRTAFVIDKVKTPLQIVRGTVNLPFDHQDWRERDAPDRDRELDALCQRDREQGFDPRRAPLMRMMLLRYDDKSWRFVWTSHHLLMDRWCLDEVFADLDHAYRALQTGSAPARQSAPSYRQYIDWISRQNRADAVAYWRAALNGFATPTLALIGAASDDQISTDRCSVERALLTAAGRRFGVAPGALLQGAIALTLADSSQQQDVVFGTAAAARPPDIPGVERIVGSFVSNLPVRVQLDSDQTVREWLTGLQRVGFERSAFEYLSPVDITACSDLPEDAPLYDTLLVWLAATDRPLPLDMQALNHDLTTAYPVTLSVAENPAQLTIHARLRSAVQSAAATLLSQLIAHLNRLCQCENDATMADLIALPAARRAAAPERSVVPRTTHRPPDDIDLSLNAGREALHPALLEQLVLNQFKAALKVDQVDPDSDFFAIGGDSLRAANMHAQICAATRQNVPLLALFRTPTVRAMATTLAEGDWPITPGISLALRTNGSGDPLFCVASPEVNTLGYFMLARHLSPARNAYVLQAPPPVDQAQPMDPSIIEPLAAQYVSAMRETQPNGPYRLLGMCGGAHLVLAMARQLEDAGQSVRFAGIVNTWSLYSVSWVYYLHRARNVSHYYLNRLRETVFGSPATTAQATASTSRPAAGPANEDVGLDSPWIRDVGFASKLPTVRPLAASAHVFRLKRQQYWRIGDRTLGWQRFFSNIRVIQLKGDDHDALLREPHVTQIATIIDPLLDEPSSLSDGQDNTLTTIKTEPVI